MRNIIIVLMCIGILVSWQICQSDLANAGGKRNKCSIAGLWLGKDTVGDSDFIATYTPLDPNGKKFTGVSDDLLYLDPQFGGDYFPADTKPTKVFGYAERIAPGIYDVSWYRYGVSETAGGVVWKMVSRGITEIVDCGNTINAAVVKVFIPIFDDEGEIEDWFPVGECVDFTSISKRVTLAPACGELPPLPEIE